MGAPVSSDHADTFLVFSSTVSILYLLTSLLVGWAVHAPCIQEAPRSTSEKKAECLYLATRLLVGWAVHAPCIQDAPRSTSEKKAE